MAGAGWLARCRWSGRRSGCGSRRIGAAGTAAGAAGSAAAGAAVDAGATEAAALAAEYAVADAAVATLAAKRGGRIRSGLAAGGTPYEASAAGTPYSMDAGQYDIPDQANASKLLTAGPLKKQPTGLQTAMKMGDPNDMSSIAGSVFSNQGLGSKRGGRIGKDDGGALSDSPDPDLDPVTIDPRDTKLGLGSALPPVTVESSKPAPVTYSGGLNPVDQPSIPVSTPDKADVAPSLWDKAKSGLASVGLDKASNVVPLLTGLAAMGTAPTRSLGVALASGLGAGAQAYLPAQAQSIQNQRAQYQLDTLRAPMPQSGGSGAPPAPSFAGTGSNPSNIAANVQKLFAFKDIYTPQEQSAIAYNQRLQAAGLPNTLQSTMALHTARMQNQQTAQTQGASALYDAAYEAASAPKGAALSKVRAIDPVAAEEILAKSNGNADDADGMARVWASQTGNAAHKYSGRPIDDKAPDGVQRDAPTGKPLLGAVPFGMSAEQSANYNAKLYGSTVDTGAPAKPTPAELAGGNLTPGSRPVAPGSPGYVAPGAAPPAPQAPVRAASAPPTVPPGPPTVSGVPIEPSISRPSRSLIVWRRRRSRSPREIRPSSLERVRSMTPRT